MTTIDDSRRVFAGLYFPKVKITNGPHDYRILAVGVKEESGDDYVELLYVFRRQEGYALDWDWIRGVLPAGPEEGDNQGRNSVD